MLKEKKITSLIALSGLLAAGHANAKGAQKLGGLNMRVGAGLYFSQYAMTSNSDAQVAGVTGYLDEIRALPESASQDAIKDIATEDELLASLSSASEGFEDLEAGMKSALRQIGKDDDKDINFELLSRTVFTSVAIQSMLAESDAVASAKNGDAIYVSGYDSILKQFEKGKDDVIDRYTKNGTITEKVTEINSLDNEVALYSNAAGHAMTERDMFLFVEFLDQVSDDMSSSSSFVDGSDANDENNAGDNNGNNNTTQAEYVEWELSKNEKAVVTLIQDFKNSAGSALDEISAVEQQLQDLYDQSSASDKNQYIVAEDGSVYTATYGEVPSQATIAARLIGQIEVSYASGSVSTSLNADATSNVVESLGSYAKYDTAADNSDFVTVGTDGDRTLALKTSSGNVYTQEFKDANNNDVVSLVIDNESGSPQGYQMVEFESIEDGNSYYFPADLLGYTTYTPEDDTTTTAKPENYVLAVSQDGSTAAYPTTSPNVNSIKADTLDVVAYKETENSDYTYLLTAEGEILVARNYSVDKENVEIVSEDKDVSAALVNAGYVDYKSELDNGVIYDASSFKFKVDADTQIESETEITGVNEEISMTDSLGHELKVKVTTSTGTVSNDTTTFTVAGEEKLTVKMKEDNGQAMQLSPSEQSALTNLVIQGSQGNITYASFISSVNSLMADNGSIDSITIKASQVQYPEGWLVTDADQPAELVDIVINNDLKTKLGNTTESQVAAQVEFKDQVQQLNRSYLTIDSDQSEAINPHAYNGAAQISTSALTGNDTDPAIVASAAVKEGDVNVALYESESSKANAVDDLIQAEATARHNNNLGEVGPASNVFGSMVLDATIEVFDGLTIDVPSDGAELLAMANATDQAALNTLNAQLLPFNLAIEGEGGSGQGSYTSVKLKSAGSTGDEVIMDIGQYATSLTLDSEQIISVMTDLDQFTADLLRAGELNITGSNQSITQDLFNTIRNLSKALTEHNFAVTNDQLQAEFDKQITTPLFQDLLDNNATYQDAAGFEIADKTVDLLATQGTVTFTVTPANYLAGLNDDGDLVPDVGGPGALKAIPDSTAVNNGVTLRDVIYIDKTVEAHQSHSEMLTSAFEEVLALEEAFTGVTVSEMPATDVVSAYEAISFLSDEAGLGSNELDMLESFFNDYSKFNVSDDNTYSFQRAYDDRMASVFEALDETGVTMDDISLMVAAEGSTYESTDSEVSDQVYSQVSDMAENGISTSTYEALFASAGAYSQNAIDEAFADYKANVDVSIGTSVSFGAKAAGYAAWRAGTSILMNGSPEGVDNDVFGGATFDVQHHLGGTINMPLNGHLNLYGIVGFTSLYGSALTANPDADTSMMFGFESGVGAMYKPTERIPVSLYVDFTVPIYFGDLSVEETGESAGTNMYMPKLSAGIQLGY